MAIRQGKIHSFLDQSTQCLMRNTRNAECLPEFMLPKHKYFDIIRVNFDFPILRKKLVEASSTAKT